MESVKHILFKLVASSDSSSSSSNNAGDFVSASEQIAWNGLSGAPTLSRTRVFSVGRSPFVAAGDEQSRSLLLWNASGTLQQRGLPAHPSPIVDVHCTSFANGLVIGSLSEGLLQFYSSSAT
jgi:hypothetical protein